MMIPGYSLYDITETCVVTEIATGKVVPHHQMSKYSYVYIKPDGATRKMQVKCHILLALTFIGPKPAGSIAHFKDNNPAHLHASNVEWGDRHLLSSSLIGARKPRPNANCNADSVDLVYDTMKTHGQPVTMLDLSNMLQVPYSLIRYSMYALVALGKVEAVKGGYVCLSQ